MYKRIRCTVTITITEVWTFVWLPIDDSAGQPPTIVQHPLAAQEETDERQQVPDPLARGQSEDVQQAHHTTHRRGPGKRGGKAVPSQVP